MNYFKLVNNINKYKDIISKYMMSFVLDCPSSIRKNDKYVPVSNRNVSFRERKINNQYLIILINEIKSYFKFGINYIKIIKSEININEYEHLKKQSEFIIFKKRDDMSDVEAIYYYIRNAFAHGSFEFCKSKKNSYFGFESCKNDKISAIMKIRIETLDELIKLKDMKIKKIKYFI